MKRTQERPGDTKVLIIWRKHGSTNWKQSRKKKKRKKTQTTKNHWGKTVLKKTQQRMESQHFCILVTHKSAELSLLASPFFPTKCQPGQTQVFACRSGGLRVRAQGYHPSVEPCCWVAPFNRVNTANRQLCSATVRVTAIADWIASNKHFFYDQLLLGWFNWKTSFCQKSLISTTLDTSYLWQWNTARASSSWHSSSVEKSLLVNCLMLLLWLTGS